MPTFTPHPYKFSPDLSFVGEVDNNGYQSRMVACSGYNTLSLNFFADSNYTLNVYISPSTDETNKVLYFSTTELAGSPFIRKLPIISKYLQVETTNVNALANIGLVSSLEMVANYTSHSFINSKVNEADLAVLARATSDYLDDVVKEQFSDVKNINIQGLVNTQIGSEHTIGLDNDYRYFTANTEATLTIASVDDNQPTGIGAFNVRIRGILDTGEEFNSLFLVNTGSGLMGLEIQAVNSMKIEDAGTSKKNQGLIQVFGGTTLLGEIQPLKNFSKCAVYRVPNDKQLVVREVLVKGESDGGKVILYELDTSTEIQYPLAEFEINIGYNQINLPVHHLIGSGNTIKANYVPSVITGAINVFVNIHGLLYNNNVPI